MIKFTFQNGQISDVSCDSPIEAAQIITAMKSSALQNAANAPTPAKRTRALKHHRTVKTRAGHKTSVPLRRGRWTVDEIRFIVNELRNGSPVSKIKTAPYLMERHVPSAIYQVAVSARAGNGKFYSKRISQLYRQVTSEATPSPVQRESLVGQEA